MTAQPSAREESQWVSMAERGSRVGIRFMVWCYRRLGRDGAGLFLYPIVAYFWLFGGDARRASRQYFARLERFSGKPPARGGTFRHFYEFAETILDRLCFWTGHYDDFEVVIRGREHMEPLVKAGQGAILVGAHLGSFDVLRVIARDASIRVNVVMFTANARRINEMLSDLDPTTTMRVIEVDPGSIRSSFEIKSCIDRGEFVAVLADRVSPGGRGRTGWAPFLGDPAPFPHGPFLIPMLLRLPVLLCLAIRREPRRYEVSIEPLAGPKRIPREDRDAVLQERIEEFAARLEHHLTRSPYQWFNFYDFWSGPGVERG